MFACPTDLATEAVEKVKKSSCLLVEILQFTYDTLAGRSIVTTAEMKEVGRRLGLIEGLILFSVLASSLNDVFGECMTCH